MKLGKFISVLAVLASAAGVIYLAYNFFKKHCLVCCDGTDGCEYLDAYTEEFGDCLLYTSVGRQLYHQRFVAAGAHLFYHVAGGGRLHAKSHAARLYVGAGDVELQQVKVLAVQQLHTL